MSHERPRLHESAYSSGRALPSKMKSAATIRSKPRNFMQRLMTCLFGCMAGVCFTLIGVFVLLQYSKPCTVQQSTQIIDLRWEQQTVSQPTHRTRDEMPVSSSAGQASSATEETALPHTSGLPSSASPSTRARSLASVDTLLTDFTSSENFHGQLKKLLWIKMRILSTNVSWSAAQTYVKRHHPLLLSSPKHILAYPGLLTETSSYDFAGSAFRGGYLGELVQWSDLLAALVILGHQVDIETSGAGLMSRFGKIRDYYYDVVFSDYIGVNTIRTKLLLPFVRCRLRLLDSFGTQPKVVFSTRSRTQAKQRMFTKFDLESYKQYLTLYPHSPDNSFLGHVGKLGVDDISGKRKNQAVVYGKESKFFEGNTALLKTISKYFEIHTTVPEGKELEKVLKDVPHINHGLLPGSNLSSLLSASKLYIGMGFPYEGPGPVEALASGCSVLLGLFKPPKHSGNTPFLSGKPTRRALHSQHPYLTDFIGEPQVYTVDLKNTKDIESVMEKILAKKDEEFKPRIQHEFTPEGFAERVGHFIYYQDFCADRSSIALGKNATSSPLVDKHTAGEAVSMDMAHTKCVWLEPKEQGVWWEVDLGSMSPIASVVVDFAPDWHVLIKMWGNKIPPFRILLLDNERKNVAKEEYTHDHIMRFEWDVENGPVRARYVRVEKASKGPQYLVLCNVGVYSTPPFRPSWPAAKHLHEVVSRIGQSCVHACMDLQMVCEPAFFPHLNKDDVLKRAFNCTSVVRTRVVNGLLESVIQELAAYPGMHTKSRQCTVNLERLLLDCSGTSADVQRLCPCRRYQSQQVALPPADVV
ncbi:alpha-1,6-mannosylglycoprotein 6-beta-N-acetylglucosaminyltransferase A-like isoform X2 [Sycon ciliatum]|uniref:alpha-1,6-mannosylglycoprotein 6-beta-N-acetylglucosaminyltransferase A-like isoform X2 n=1 Tax=Sycon ciliatum TaxID=27933 RepID=UPI0031F63D74